MNGRGDKTESEQIDFFERSYERFLRAKESAGGDSHFYRVGDSIVCVTFAGETLGPYITPALEHLRVPAAEPDLTLCAWDSRSTSVDMVPPPCARQDFTDHGEVLGFNSSRVKFAFRWSDYSVNLLDRATRTGIYWVPDARAVPYWARAVPLRSLLHWWMQHNNYQVLHGSAVGTEDGAVLLTGRSGVGKSTVALSCLQAGLYYLGDDCVAVRLDPEPVVYSLYCAAKLDAKDIAHFPSFANLVYAPEKAGGEKLVILLHPHFERQIVSEMRLKAIVLPRLVDLDETRVTPAAGWRVLRAFTTVSELKLPHGGRRTREFIDRLCSIVPGYSLDIGRSRQITPPAIADLLNRLPDAPPAHPPQSRDARDPNPTPLVSVIVVVFNGQRHIRNAVERALSQDYPALEIVVVDDGSTDRTAEIVSRLPHAVRYFRVRQAGPASAWNRGIREASGDFLAFLDVHDEWPENALGRLVGELLRDREIDVAHGYSQFVRQDPENDGYQCIGNRGGDADFRPGAAVFRRSAFSKAGLFDGTLMSSLGNDWLARARASNVRIRRVEEATLLVRKHGLGVTGENPGEFGPHRLLKEALDWKRAQTGRARGGQ